MKFNKILLPLLVLIATSFVAIFIYDLINNIGSDSLVNVTNNNNVIINQISDFSARSNTNVTHELTTNDTNSITELPNGSSKANVIIAVSITVFCLVVLSGVGLQAYSYYRNVANTPATENF